MYMNRRRPIRKIFISMMPISFKRAMTSGHASRWYRLYRSMTSASSLSSNVNP